MTKIVYRPEATGLRFHRSRKVVRGLMGPIGSGKSVTCVNELLRLGMAQRVQSDGKRRMRVAIVRNTYPELLSTTVKTFKDWAPPEHTKWRMTAPINATITTANVEWEFIFLALDRPDDVKKLLSLEVTAVWINEAREIPYEVVRAAIGRIGRYPAKRDGGPVQPCVMMDTNPMDTDHWWYRKFETEKPEGWELFKQPPALIKNEYGIYIPNPEAENIGNLALGYTYYLQMVPGNDDNWIGVYILGQYGSVMDGKPVYAQYRDDVHCAKEELRAIPGLPIYLGWDYGRTPAVVFCQYTPNGVFRIIDEQIVDTDGDGMGIRTFTRDVVNPYIATQYPEFRFIERGDPAGVAKDGSEMSCFDLQHEEGRVVSAAMSNLITPRLDAVSRYMSRMVDGGPAFQLSPKCTVLRKGFLGGYKYERVKVSGDERYRDEPAKNKYSHPHDALQYAALAVIEGQGHRVVTARPVQRVSRGSMV